MDTKLSIKAIENLPAASRPVEIRDVEAVKFLMLLLPAPLKVLCF